MVGVEINMVVTDSVKALALYESIFEVERLEVTAYERGLNEAIFTLFDTRFHLLDENAEYGLLAPKEREGRPMWVNILVPDVNGVFTKAVENGCTTIQPVTEVASMGVSNAVISDPFGYVWMLHQIHRVVSFEERTQYFDAQFKRN